MMSACSTWTLATNTQVVSILKRGLTVSVMMDFPEMGIHVKTSMSVKAKYIAATRMLNALIHLARFS